MTRLLRFAIIGCGRIAGRHAVEMLKHGQITAVCDTVPEKAMDFAARYGATPYFSLDDLLADGKKKMDIAVICTPNGFHAAHSIQALDAGLHVLCEKPMAIAGTDAVSMIEAADRNRKSLFVVKQNRFNPPVRFVKELLDERKLGRIVSFQLNCFWNRPAGYYLDSWHGTKDLDGGILYTQFSHFIDILYWFLGDVVEARGYRSNALHTDCMEIEDNGVAVIKMVNEITGTLNYSINAYKKNMEGSLTLFGEKGTVRIGGQYLNELDYFSVGNETPPLLSEGNVPNRYGFYEGSMSNHDKVYEAFVKAIDDPGYPLASANETLKTVQIIERIYESSPFIL